MIAVLALLALIASLPAYSEFRLAVDINQLGSPSDFVRLRSQQYDTVFVRAYRPDQDGTPDYYAPANIKAASAAGLGVEVYAVPAATSLRTSAIKQMDDAITTLQSAGFTVRALWLQVTTPVNWNSNAAPNVDFIKSAIQRIRARNVRPGIYTNQFEWSQITNLLSNLGSDVMLCPFAQWTSPMAKQFGQQESPCEYSLLNLNREIFQAKGMARNSSNASLSVSSTKIVVGGIGLDTPLN